MKKARSHGVCYSVVQHTTAAVCYKVQDVTCGGCRGAVWGGGAGVASCHPWVSKTV